MSISDSDRGTVRAHVFVFSDEEDFEAKRKAESFLRERGFSYGRWQRGSPAGILFGEYDIQKWRNLNADDRRALHGHMTGDGRKGPIMVRIFAHAPAEAIAAIRKKAEAA